jgi:hypothetical protein
MLNLNRREDMLTQGQPPAERVLANPGSQGNVQREQANSPESGASQAPVPGSSPAAASPDVKLIANRVYDLMRNDLLVLNERSGYRIGR